MLYVLDEPSIGLHQRDNERLLETLRRLRDLGNSVIVVEHDEDAIRTADWVVDVGPGAGIHGGEIVSQGTAAQVMADPNSLTGQYLTGARQVALPRKRRKANPERVLTIRNARGNNLKGVSADLPLGLFTAVTGVSGGGKSTLIIDTLYKAVARRLNGAFEHPAPHDSIEGMEHLDKVIDIDQSPIGRTPRSNPATYTGAFTPIRDWFAGLPEAKARGYQPGRFSFNVKGGRCGACQGDGVIKIEMHFLPDVFVTCDVCKGRRYDRETLEVKYRNKSIADVLDMTVEEAADLFKAVPPIRDKMLTLARVGLGYVKVGQQANTLSGGEAQRVKLAKELSKRATRAHALHPGRTDHRPALPRRRQAAGSAAGACRGRQFGGGHRAQSRSHQDGRLGHRPGSRGGRRAAARSWAWARPRRSCGWGAATPDDSSRTSWSDGRRRRSRCRSGPAWRRNSEALDSSRRRRAAVVASRSILGLRSHADLRAEPLLQSCNGGLYLAALPTHFGKTATSASPSTAARGPSRRHCDANFAQRSGSRPDISAGSRQAPRPLLPHRNNLTRDRA